MVREIQTTEKTQRLTPLLRLRCHRCHQPVGISAPTDDGTCGHCGSGLIEFAPTEEIAA